jgi:hypothetical protein
MEGGGGKLMRMLSACVAERAPPMLESVTFTVKFVVPFGPVGVPVIPPVLLLKVSPAGNDPVLTE